MHGFAQFEKLSEVVCPVLELMKEENQTFLKIEEKK